MASKAELLDALNARGNMLQGWLNDIGSNIETKQAELNDLRNQRRDKLAEIVSGLLPDLSESSLAAVQQSVPNFLTPAQAAQMRFEESEVVKRQLERHRAGFDPDGYAGNVDMITEQVNTARNQLSALDAEFAQLMATPGLGDLIQRHYGEQTYTRDPHHHILGMLYDWVHADDVAREIGMDGWPQVRAKYRDFIERRNMLNQTIEQASAQLQKLSQNKRLLDELGSITDDKLERRVLERARTGLAARLDSLGEPADLLRKVRDIDAQISALQSEINTLQAKKSTVSEQLDQTLQLRMTAASSAKQQVPDEYVTQIRGSVYQANTPITGGYGGYNQTYIQPVYMYDDTSWVLPTLFYMDMADHWGGYHGGGQTIVNNYIETGQSDVYASSSNFSSSS
ncbi:MAG: hypothetical protein ACREDR_16705 [Blastocatellia bacterium]